MTSLPRLPTAQPPAPHVAPASAQAGADVWAALLSACFACATLAFAHAATIVAPSTSRIFQTINLMLTELQIGGTRVFVDAGSYTGKVAVFFAAWALSWPLLLMGLRWLPLGDRLLARACVFMLAFATLGLVQPLVKLFANLA